MQITHVQPGSWQDLEIEVARILAQCGFATERGKQILTTRTTVNVDVFAQDTESVPVAEYIIECKYWDKRIPQEVIHAFRTTVNDYGAHHGLIIAKKGFQSGAYGAVQNTNIQLLSWDEFLILFERIWLENKINNLHSIAEPLFVYTDPLDVSDYLNSFSQDQISEYKKLCKKYLLYVVLSNSINFKDILSHKLFSKAKIDDFIRKNQKSFDGYIVNSYTDFFELLESKCLEALRVFEDLFKNTDAISHTMLND